MSDIVVATLQDKKDALQKRLDEINKILSINTTDKLFRSLKGVSKCIKFHQKTGKPYYLKRAEAWDNARKKYAEIDKKIVDNGHFADEKIELQTNIRHLAEEIRYMSIKRGKA